MDKIDKKLFIDVLMKFAEDAYIRYKNKKTSSEEFFRDFLEKTNEGIKQEYESIKQKSCYIIPEEFRIKPNWQDIQEDKRKRKENFIRNAKNIQRSIDKKIK